MIITSDRFKERLYLLCDDSVTVVIEVQAVYCVLFSYFFVIGVKSEILKHIEYRNAQLLRRSLDSLNVEHERLCVGSLHRTGRGILIRAYGTATMGGCEERELRVRVSLAEIRHKVANRAAECGRGVVTVFTYGSVTVELIVYSAVNYHKVSVLYHLEHTSAEVKIVSGIFTGL